jgi:hypothetical protein
MKDLPDMSVISTWTAFKVSLSLDLRESSVIDGLVMFAYLASSARKGNAGVG